LAATSAQPYVPADADLDDLRLAVQGCRGCDLYRDATQAVFSRGDVRARVIMIGEVPGDMEDRQGEPFVGPAGRVLSRAMADAGIAPSDTYLTNAVKHFKFHIQERGKRRIHDKPGRTEVLACRPWLHAEFALLRPIVVVALGATAAQALAGPSFRVTNHRGELLEWPAAADRPDDFPSGVSAHFIATVHPSSVLRADDRDAAYADFAADLRAVAAALQ
jgi:DNA polymerase